MLVEIYFVVGPRLSDRYSVLKKYADIIYTLLSYFNNIEKVMDCFACTSLREAKTFCLQSHVKRHGSSLLVYIVIMGNDILGEY